MLPVQAVLLFWNLDLLSAWTDELFTLGVAPRPLGEIVSRLVRDIHPPQYYFQLHAVNEVLGGAGVLAYRSVSAVWALVLTALMDILWMRRWTPASRLAGLSLIALSPTILLYGRMARSYSMQAALTVMAVWTINRWLKQPGKIGTRALPAVLAAALLLYTHYAPGLAVLGGFAVVALRKLGWRRATVFVSVVLLLYAPWLLVLARALSRWGAAPDFSSRYTLTGSWFPEQFVKLGFGWTSLSIGESFPAISFLLSGALFLLLALSARRTSVFRRNEGVALCIAAVLGYVAVSRWVSYPFTPARLLWLLPFLVIAWTAGLRALPPLARCLFFAAVMASHIVSIGFYFNKRDFLNPGYSAPLREIAAKIVAESNANDVVLFDAYNTDGASIGHYLGKRVPWRVVRADERDQANHLRSLAGGIWVIRNTRDISPGRFSSRMETEACADRIGNVELWHPYAGWQVAAMWLLGIPDPPRHVYRVTRCRTSG